jgi:hypothetical protein
MKTKVRYVGLDVHKFTITIAVAEEGYAEYSFQFRWTNAPLRESRERACCAAIGVRLLHRR